MFRCGIILSALIIISMRHVILNGTNGILQDIYNKRNPRLVPYNLLDEKTKKTNRDTVCAAVRTLIGYGYNIEPPDQESSEYPGTYT